MDVVLFAGSAYIASKRHLSSSSGSRPDLDIDYTQEEFWTLFIQGEATNVLRERGDLRTHNSQTDSSLADERLAIGTPGQILKANNPFNATLDTGEIAQWGNFGVTPKVYYVSTSNGEDIASKGTKEISTTKMKYFLLVYQKMLQLLEMNCVVFQYFQKQDMKQVICFMYVTVLV